MRGSIALVVVGYNRPRSMRRILDSLNRAKYDYTEIPLMISIDNSGDDSVRKEAESFQWKHGEKKLICHKERMGLRKHIISCGDLTEEYGAVMILEDDLYVSPDYYNYAMKALEKYGDHPKIAGISPEYQAGTAGESVSVLSKTYRLRCVFSAVCIFLGAGMEPENVDRF